jgi:hypothetical protein
VGGFFVPGRRPEPVAGHSVRDVRDQENIVVTRPKKTNTTPPGFAALLAGAKLPERTVPICMRGDLQAEHERLNDELELLEKKAVDSLAGNGGAELAARIDELEGEMRKATHQFRLRALPGREFRAFKAKYPPRTNDDGEIADRHDQLVEFDADAGAEPLIRASIIDPELTGETWSVLLDVLTDRQFDDLFTAAWLLNRGEINIPFSRAASRLNRTIGADSKPPTG